MSIFAEQGELTSDLCRPPKRYDVVIAFAPGCNQEKRALQVLVHETNLSVQHYLLRGIPAVIVRIRNGLQRLSLFTRRDGRHLKQAETQTDRGI